MSVRFSGVFVVPGSEKPGGMHDRTQNNPPAKVKNVAIVAPTRSNSLDYLNFEEKRQLIASSLSLSDFLSVGKEAKEIKQIKETGVTAVIVGELVVLTIQQIYFTHQIKMSLDTQTLTNYMDNCLLKAEKFLELLNLSITEISLWYCVENNGWAQVKPLLAHNFSKILGSTALRTYLSV